MAVMELHVILLGLNQRQRDYKDILFVKKMRGGRIIIRFILKE
jgi:hypothetical protein